MVLSCINQFSLIDLPIKSRYLVKWLVCIYPEISAIPFLLHRDIDQNGCCYEQRFIRFYRRSRCKRENSRHFSGYKVCDKEEKEEDVWQDIATALEDWTQRILDTKSRRAT